MDETVTRNCYQLALVVCIFIFSTPKWNYLVIEEDNRSPIDWSDLIRDSQANLTQVNHYFHNRLQNRNIGFIELRIPRGTLGQAI